LSERIRFVRRQLRRYKYPPTTTYYNSVIPPTFRAQAMGVTTTGKADDDVVAHGADATAAATNAGVDFDACDDVVVDVDLMSTAN